MTPEEIALRDDFAKAALQGILACPREYEGITDFPKSERNQARANLAYVFADAMMEARKNT